MQQGRGATGGDGEGATLRGRPEWSNTCQPSWTWHVRNASYVFPPTNSFLVHPPFPSPTSAHIKLFLFKYTLLNKQADMKTGARMSSLKFPGWSIHEGEVVFWSAFAFCSGWFTRNSELFNWKAGPLTETCTVMPGKKRTFSNCISVVNYEAYIPIKEACDTTRLKRAVSALVSPQEAGSVRPARVDLPPYRPFLTANQWPSRTLPLSRGAAQETSGEDVHGNSPRMHWIGPSVSNINLAASL